MVTNKDVGDGANAQALRHLLAHGLTLVQRNYRVAAGRRLRRGGIDRILREPDGSGCSSKCARTVTPATAVRRPA